MLHSAPAAAASFRVDTFAKSTAPRRPPRSCPWTRRDAEGDRDVDLRSDQRDAGGSFLYAFGVTDGVTSRSVATASHNAADPSDTTRRIATKPITIVRWARTSSPKPT